MDLRDYQHEAVESVFREWGRVDSTLVVLATGLGKTVIGSTIIGRVAASGGRVLWLAHRTVLLKAAKAAIENVAGVDVDLEQAGHRACGLFIAPCVVGSVQTMKGSRLASWPRNSFSHIIVDEAHRTTARSYRNILEHFGDAKVLGLTATPDRGDGVAMGHVFESVAIQHDLRWGVEHGYLSQPRTRYALLGDIDLDSIDVKNGELVGSQLGEVLSKQQNIIAAATPILQYAHERPTVAFCASVKHAQALAKKLRESGCEAHCISAKTHDSERDRLLAAYASGEIRVLCNVGIFTEGWDAPWTACVAMVRPTKSRALYAQCIGRGSRLWPGKSDFVIIDYAANSLKHQLVCSLDVLEGKPLPDDVKKAAKKAAEDGATDLEAIEAAKQEAAERERQAIEEQRNDLAVVGRAAVEYAEIDHWTASPISPEQAALLDRFKIKHQAQTKGEANAIIGDLMRRGRGNLATEGQARVLTQKGLRSDIPKRLASKIIDAIASNGWRVPDDIRSEFASDVEECF